MIGTYQWIVTYSGDGNNNAVASVMGNDPVMVNPASPTIVTTTNPTSVTLNGSSPILTDSATLTGGYNETGTIIFSLFGPSGESPVFTETVSVSGDGTYTTSTGYTLPTTGSVIGTYQWVVRYSGDANNNGANSAQGSEPVAVHAASPSLSTTANPSQVTLSNTAPPILKDSATLAGGYYETGTLTFDLYGPDGLTVVHTEIVSVNGNGTYSTPAGYTLPTTGTVIGTYQWIVSYSGDVNNNGVTSVKGSEPVIVNGYVPTTVQDLVRLGYHDQPTRIVLTFSAALDPASASDLANYQLVSMSPHHRGVSAPIPIKAAIYNPIAHTVKLRPYHRLYLYSTYRLTISGVRDANGNPIAGNGGPGGSFVAIFGKNSLRGITFTSASAVPRPSNFAHRGPHAVSVSPRTENKTGTQLLRYYVHQFDRRRALVF